MLVAVAVILALSAGLLGFLLVLSRQRSEQQIAAAEAEVERVTTDLAALKDRVKASDRRGEKLDAQVAELKAQTEQSEATAEAAYDRALEVETDHMTALTALAIAEQERNQFAVGVEEIAAERDSLEAALEPLHQHLAIFEAEAEQFRDQNRPGLEADALWAMELSRSERTWRHSVSATPDGPSPFNDVDDALRLAIETEVAALREDVGAAMELEWDVPLDDPARSLIVLRLVQELLAVAAHDQQAVILRGHPGQNGTIELHLTVPAGHPPVQVEPPLASAHLISFTADNGLRITVH